MEIELLLLNWKKESLFGERYFQKQTYSLIEGQDLFLISFRYKVRTAGKEKLIEKHKFFQTNFKGLTDNKDINPKADEYICKQILSLLESDFFFEFNEFIEEESRKNTP